jgi:hypothetical protein
MLQVREGRIAVTRLYDLAYAIDLDRVEREVSESATRLRLWRVKPPAIFYARPPVDIHLGSASVALGAETFTVDVKARVFDFGAVRLSYEFPVESATWAEYVALVDRAETLLDAPDPWASDIGRIGALIEVALSKPSESELIEDYVYATIRRLDPALPGEELADTVDLVPILTGEHRALSRQARDDIREHSYSYFADDLVVIGWSRALIVEPEGDTDVADILGMAHAQLLELRYFNERLDQELPRMYERIEHSRSRFAVFARRRLASLARSLHQLLAEVTEVSERIENALIVTEDVYLADVYGAALDRHRVRDWSGGVERKLTIIRETYAALYDEAMAGRAESLEVIIVLLIALEIILAFLL